MVVSHYALTRWHSLLANKGDEHSGAAALRRLYRRDHERFVLLCRQLADDDLPTIKATALRMLGYYGEPEDTQAQSAALRALSDPATRDAALLALGKVGTAEAFPVLFHYASEGATPKGSDIALRGLVKRATTEEQRHRVLELSRRLVLAEDFQVRIAAVQALRAVSNPVAEEQLLLEAASRYPDETIFGALGHATTRILPELREMRSRFRPGTAQYQEMSRAIESIEIRQSTT